MKEALKLALEALEDWDSPMALPAIYAIKEALAQPDYRAVKTYHEGKPVYVSQPEQDTMTLQEVWDAAGNNPEIKPTKKDVLLALKLLDAICEAADVPPEQEPVAFISPGGHIHYDPYLDSVPLYTTPPKRPWVGLTDEERNYCVETPFVSQQWANIEAKLKELNT